MDNIHLRLKVKRYFNDYGFLLTTLFMNTTK